MRARDEAHVIGRDRPPRSAARLSGIRSRSRRAQHRRRRARRSNITNASKAKGHNIRNAGALATLDLCTTIVASDPAIIGFNGNGLPGGDVDALEEIVEAQIVEIIEKRLGRAVDDLDGGAERRDWGMWIGAKHVKSAIQLTEFYRKQQAFGDVDVVDGADDADGCAARIARVAAADARADGPDALLNKSMFENEERPYLALFSALLVRYPRTNPAGAQGSGGVVSVAKFAHDYGLFQGYGLKGRAARKPTQQADKPTVAECVEYLQTLGLVDEKTGLIVEAMPKAPKGEVQVGKVGYKKRFVVLIDVHSKIGAAESPDLEALRMESKLSTLRISLEAYRVVSQQTQDLSLIKMNLACTYVLNADLELIIAQAKNSYSLTHSHSLTHSLTRTGKGRRRELRSQPGVGGVGRGGGVGGARSRRALERRVLGAASAPREPRRRPRRARLRRPAPRLRTALGGHRRGVVVVPLRVAAARDVRGVRAAP